MKLTPGTILAYEWGLCQPSDDGTPHVWKLDETLEAVREEWPVAVRIVDKATGKPVEHVESYNPITGQLVRFVVGRSGDPSKRVNAFTGEEYMPKIVETRFVDVIPQ